MLLLPAACGEADHGNGSGAGPTGGAGGGTTSSGGSTTTGGGGADSGVRYDQIRQKSVHNAFQRHEALFDQLVYHRVRSVELDLHIAKSGWPTVAGHWFVYHEPNDSNSRCHQLDDCLHELRSFHQAVPEHEVVTVFPAVSKPKLDAWRRKLAATSRG